MTRPHSSTDASIPPVPANPAPTDGGKFLFDLAGIHLRGSMRSRDQIEQLLPHRGVMSLLDAVAWHDEGWMRCIGRKDINADEFWCAGHFPGKPTFPGVLMIETAAQLSAHAFLARLGRPSLVLFLRIEDAAFRGAIFPGDSVYILCEEVKANKRRFITRVQGLIGDPTGALTGKIAFEATLNGMMVDGAAF